MNPSLFVFPFQVPALSVRYARSTGFVYKTMVMDEYWLFAIKTQITHELLGPEEEFNVFMCDLMTHYQCLGEVVSKGESIVVGQNQATQIRNKIARQLESSSPIGCVLFTSPDAEHIASSYPSPYRLWAVQDVLYVDLSTAPNFEEAYEEISVGLWYSLAGHELPRQREASDPADLTQPLQVSDAPLVL